MSNNSRDKENLWGFYGLPPFFTEQPASGTLERQLTLWHALLLDHAIYYASKATSSTPPSFPFIRLYDEHSDIFVNPELQRRMPPQAARQVLLTLATQHPTEAVIVPSAPGESPLQVLVASTRGGLKELEEGVLRWVLELGEGTTTTMLKSKGAVFTFEEMVEKKALFYGLGKYPCSSSANDGGGSHSSVGASVVAERLSSTTPLPCKDLGTISEEQALRLLFKAQQNRIGSATPWKSFAITLFNLDGTDEEPYQGVKIGGGSGL